MDNHEEEKEPLIAQSRAGEAVANLTDELCVVAMKLYTPPFHFESGYIMDANHMMVADDGGICRVRGWGRIQKQPNAEALQDKVGELIAQAMTDYWQAHNV